MLCASTRGDDANQWRLYGNGGRGYCVEIDTRFRLSVVEDGHRPTYAELGEDARRRRVTAETSRWMDVLYTEPEKSEALGRLAERIRTETLCLQAKADKEGWGDGGYDSVVQSELYPDHQSSLFLLAQLMKTECFEGENEVRLIAHPAHEQPPRFRPTAHGAVQYQRLTQSPDQMQPLEVVFRQDATARFTLPIRSVRMGPLLHADRHRHTIERLLKANGFENVPVHQSQVPLR